MQQQFNYTTQFRCTRVPKVSVHATGWVQVEESNGSNTVGPLYIPELAKLEDAIVATISVTDVAKLRTTDQTLDTDLLIAGKVSQGLTALAYISHEPEFRRRFSPGTRLVKAKLPGMKNTIYLGVELLAAKPSTGDDAPAFELLVGLDPRHQPGAEKEMLFIVGQ